MKAQVLTVLSVLIFGMTTSFGTVSTVNDSLNEKTKSVECVIYTSQDGLITFRMVKAPGEIIRVGFYDAEGNLLADRKFKRINNVKLSYDLSDCPSGVYEIRVRSHNEVLFSGSVVNPQAGLASK
ncbi:MAG: hypothetical protein PHD61_09055 [Bacteroidales bacterium]|nr:hypothetical protein [Lentimicrobiaceae bacterium]MDD5695433.1 hypothetical protein [Bacteroidales bacterium]